MESDENWQMPRQFVIDIVHEALEFDGSNSSNALTSSAATPSEISGKFNTISYSKGNFFNSNLIGDINSYKCQLIPCWKQFLSALMEMQ